MDSYENEKVYSVKEVSRVLGWSPDTIRRLIYRGHLRATILPKLSRGRHRKCFSARVRERDIKRFLEKYRSESE